MTGTNRNTTGAQAVPLPKPKATPWLWTRTRWKKFSTTAMFAPGASHGGGNVPMVQNFVI